ncbi:MAG: hypothetical protein HYT03_00270 [Candidatus Harrisonbacteria bacterium]|nr:hypothetical protein [Candidatus Harrisonbacteria bacterium]
MAENIYGLGDYSTNQIKEFAKAVEDAKLNNKLIFQRRPDAVQNPAGFVKMMPLEMVAHIIPDAFSGKLGEQLTTALSSQQLEKIGAEGDPYLKEAVRISLASILQQNPNNETVKEMVDYVNQSPAWQ